jgi:hypothetical protein
MKINKLEGILVKYWPFEKMKKLFLVLILCPLMFSSCQFISAIMTTPTFSETHVYDNPAAINSVTPNDAATQVISGILTASPKPENTSTPSPVILSTSTPTFLLILQTGSPAYIQNFVHTNEGCAWIGIAGQVFNSNGQPVNNLVVNVKGTLGSTAIDEVAVTGIPEANSYGPGGYEIKIGDKPVASKNTLTIQVLDLKGKALSKAVTFVTFSDCKRNLIIINFQMK